MNTYINVYFSQNIFMYQTPTSCSNEHAGGSISVCDIYVDLYIDTQLHTYIYKCVGISHVTHILNGFMYITHNGCMYIYRTPNAVMHI